jgi:hypothetical protein
LYDGDSWGFGLLIASFILLGAVAPSFPKVEAGFDWLWGLQYFLGLQCFLGLQYQLLADGNEHYFLLGFQCYFLGLQS